MKEFKVSSVLLIAIFTLVIFLHSVGAESFGLVVQDGEIVPAVARVGEFVSVNMTIKNTGKNSTSCNVMTFCGDCVVGIQEIPTIAPQASIPLLFKLDTSNLSSGNYFIEALIKESSGEQKIFDLGNLTIEQEDLTIPDEVTEPQPNSTKPLDPDKSPPDTNPTNPDTPSAATTAYSDWQYALLPVVLLSVVPAGAAASIIVMQRLRNNSQKPEIWAPELTREMEELEKEFKRQFGIGKVKVALALCAVTLLLAVSSLWLYV